MVASLHEQLEQQEDDLQDAAIAVDTIQTALSATGQKLEAAHAAALPFVSPAANMSTAAANAALQALQDRCKELKKDLAARRKLPSHHPVPVGSSCAVTFCEHQVEVQLGCGHYLCRPCNGQLQDGAGGGSFKCPLCKGTCGRAVPGGPCCFFRPA
jgi:hypothetical protein